MSEEIDAEKLSVGTMLSKSSSNNSDNNNRGGTINDEEVGARFGEMATTTRT